MIELDDLNSNISKPINTEKLIDNKKNPEKKFYNLNNNNNKNEQTNASVELNIGSISEDRGLIQDDKNLDKKAKEPTITPQNNEISCCEQFVRAIKDCCSII